INLTGIPYLGQASPLKDPSGKIIGYQVQLRSKSEILALLSKIRVAAAAIGLSALVIAILLSFFIARGVTRPLDKLIAGTVAVEEGNLDYHIEVKTRDELGKLADSFNEMIKELKEKERVKDIFGKFMSKAVAERALAHRGEFVLGGS